MGSYLNKRRGSQFAIRGIRSGSGAMNYLQMNTEAILIVKFGMGILRRPTCGKCFACEGRPALTPDPLYSARTIRI